MIRRLHHAQITIPKGQESEARRFYCDILGLAEIPKPPSLVGRGGFWMGLGDLQIHVGVEGEWDRTMTKAHLAYEVSDLVRLRRAIETAGCSTTNSIPIEGYVRFECRDPFGNRLEFLQAM